MWKAISETSFPPGENLGPGSSQILSLLLLGLCEAREGDTSKGSTLLSYVRAVVNAAEEKTS